MKKTKGEGKKVKSEVVIPTELDKISFDIENFKFNQKQIDFYNLCSDDKVKMVLINGPAGTSKTLLAVHSALWLLKKVKVEEILYIRTPIETGDHDLGFLPGDLAEKTNPYLAPLEDKLDELLKPDAKSNLIKGKYIKGMPVNYIRGSSWRNKAIIADEMQNSSVKTLQTLMTRIGEGCKVFIAGDHQQSDIGKKSGFKDIINLFDTEEARNNGIYVVKFDESDVVRSELCPFITKTFTKYSESKVEKSEKKNLTLIKE